jgi:hypothetical protein
VGPGEAAGAVGEEAGAAGEEAGAAGEEAGAAGEEAGAVGEEAGAVGDLSALNPAATTARGDTSTPTVPAACELHRFVTHLASSSALPVQRSREIVGEARVVRMALAGRLRGDRARRS